MHKKLVRAGTALLAFVSMNVFGEDLASYVARCKTEVGFTTIPAMNCRNGILFAVSQGGTNDSTNDWVGHVRVNESVDAVFACRWLDPNRPTQLAASVEMQVHNRDSGNTCFFSATRRDNPNSQVFVVDPNIVSPTATTGRAPSDYWDRPDQIANTIFECVGCHVNGPYIASPRIADTLAQFGLLNNGHDTYLDGTTSKKFHAVSNPMDGAFRNWDNLVNQYAERNGCSQGCHVIGYNSPAQDVIVQLPILLPSISRVIGQIGEAGVMAPLDDTSAYRWINRDNPFKAGDPGDVERFGYAKAEYGTLLANCVKPRTVIAHAADDDMFFRTPESIPDRLAVFNLRDGLKCNNADQADGQCNDYQTSYRCSDGTWTQRNTDTPAGTGDDESRSRRTDLTGKCANPTAIQAQTLSGHGQATISGPKDRLAQFDAEGLECRNADQGAGQSCSNYVVKFVDCDPNAAAPTYNLVSSASNRDITATGPGSGVETRAQPDNNTWNTQDWVVESIWGSRNVRLKNNGTGKYLSVQSTADRAKVIAADLQADSLNMQWISEPVAGSNDVRLRNAAANKYLTVADSGDFAAVLSQGFNGTWNTQRWKILKQAF